MLIYFSEKNDNGKKIFNRLLYKMDNNVFDDNYLELLAAYQSIYGETDRSEIFFAKYLLAKKLYEAALEAVMSAQSKRPANRMVWKLMIECYMGLGRPIKCLPYLAYLFRFYGEQLSAFSGSDRQVNEALRVLSIAAGTGDYDPFMAMKFSRMDDGSYEKSSGIIIGEYLFPFFTDKSEYRHWVGIYQENGWLGHRGEVLDYLRDSEIFSRVRGADMVTFDFIRSKELTEYQISVHEEPVVVPIAGTEINQRVDAQSQDLVGTIDLGKYVYSFIRVDNEAYLKSDKPMAIGAPIYLKHTSNRKKLVLNLLVDGLCWRAVKDQNYTLMPNTVEFFKSGIIFNQHYSVSEYTYPSLVTIETGMYPYRHHILLDEFNSTLPNEIMTLSEQMKKLGYYCVNVMGGGYLYTGATRGYDRLIVSPYELHTYVGVERIIRQIEAFGETDQFIFAHFMDTHPYYIGNFQIPVAAETKIDITDRISGQSSQMATSVFLPSTNLYMEANHQAIRNTDRALGVLYKYLQENFADDEYILQLYSDHGATIYDAQSRLLSEPQVSSAYMLRGAGVPDSGFVEELTCTADVYPTLGHLVGYTYSDIDGNLPAVFGGRERDYVISTSIYGGQTFKFCVRTQEHECYLESKDTVEFDGTVDLTGSEMWVNMRHGDKHEICDPKVQAYFLDIIRKHTSTINNEGHFWPQLRENRPAFMRRQ